MKWTNETIKEIRNNTGMSQRKFAKKYNIPERTLASWEKGERHAPEYVTEMLAKIVGLEGAQITAWYLHIYDEEGGVGEFQRYETKEDAIIAGEKEWDHLTSKEQKRFRHPASEFCVAQFELIWDEDEMEWYPDVSAYSPEWSPLGDPDIGEVYEDPEGIWAIIDVNGEEVTVRNIQDGNLNEGKEFIVPLSEVKYYL